ncbi:MAG: DNA-binding protein [Elusimicrobia bacterium RIFOXYD2_FULL_34_15]|nr:MAG: DNA-binding protein [Elusimicrobia bacterium RIFOXYD2_FULL_34_15]
MKALVMSQKIEGMIYFIRGQKVMLDHDLAVLYDVPTKVLIQAVKRNIKRFPSDCVFQLNKVELQNWRSQIVTSNPFTKMGLRRCPYAFTEQGVAMLSGILNSDRAITVNIQIMRTFTKLRALISTHKDLQRKIEEMEKKYDHQFKIVFDAIRQIIAPPEPKRKKIGFM